MGPPARPASCRCEAAGGGRAVSPSSWQTTGRCHPLPKGAQMKPLITVHCPSLPGRALPSRTRVSVFSHLGASRPFPAPARDLPRPGKRLHIQPRFVAVPTITHYLPQANVARDGQSERQCNILHGLSHGSVQNPANTEVRPTYRDSSPRLGTRGPATAAR